MESVCPLAADSAGRAAVGEDKDGTGAASGLADGIAAPWPVVDFAAVLEVTIEGTEDAALTAAGGAEPDRDA